MPNFSELSVPLLGGRPRSVFMIANPTEVPCHAVLAAKNKCLAQSNKSRAGCKATKKRVLRYRPLKRFPH
jgi:hypothetical protein